MDAFYCQVESGIDPSLKGKPMGKLVRGMRVERDFSVKPREIRNDYLTWSFACEWSDRI